MYSNGGDKICPNCGRALSQFIKTGFLGCNYCYQSFADEIGKMLPPLQVKTENKGIRADGGLPDKELLIAEVKRMRDLAASEQRYLDAEILDRQITFLDGAGE